MANQTIFIGRLGRMILFHTDVSNSFYLQKLNSWHSKDEREIIGIKFFDLLVESIGAFGVNGLDTFFGFSIVKDLNIIINYIIEFQKVEKSKYLLAIRNIVKHLQPLVEMPQSSMIYNEAIKSTEKIQGLAKSIAKIGQKQLIRKHIANILRFKSTLESNPLYCALETLNTSVLNDIRAHYRDPNLPFPRPENGLFAELGSYLEHIGIYDPINKIYLAAEPIFDFPFILFTLVIRTLAVFSFDAHLGNRLNPKTIKKDSIDDVPFIIGIITLLKQFHAHTTTTFFAYIGQYIRCIVASYVEKNIGKVQTYPDEVNKMLTFFGLILSI